MNRSTNILQTTATDSESEVHKCHLFVWMQWEGFVWFDFLVVEKGKRAKQNTDKANITRFFVCFAEEFRF